MQVRFWTIGVAVLLSASAGGAQTLSGSIRARAESWKWFETPAADGSYTYIGALGRVGVSQQGSWLGWRIEAAVPVLLGLPGDAVAPAPAGQLGAGASYWQASDSSENTVSVFLKQAFIRFGRPQAQGGHSVKLGRFEFLDGSELAPRNLSLAALKRDRIAQRLIGNFGWSHVQRSYDGAQYGFDRAGLNVTALALRPTRGVFDVAGMKNIPVGMAYASINGALSGDAADWRLFLLHYRDYRDDPRPVKVDNRALSVRAADAADVVVNSVGGHYIRAFATGAGAIDVLFWAALQNGEWGALHHRAHAFSVEAGLQPKAFKRVRPWIRAGYTAASGDGDALDDRHDTFFQVMPTPRVYARFPFYNMMNVNDAFASLLVRPGGRLSIRTDVHRLQLNESRDLWYAGGGAFEQETFGYAGRPANGESSLATTVDLSADFRINDHISINGYAAIARGGDVVQRIYTSRNASLGYIEIELRK